jgi:hypothetical protein
MSIPQNYLDWPVCHVPDLEVAGHLWGRKILWVGQPKDWQRHSTFAEKDRMLNILFRRFRVYQTTRGMRNNGMRKNFKLVRFGDYTAMDGSVVKLGKWKESHYADIRIGDADWEIRAPCQVCGLDMIWDMPFESNGRRFQATRPRNPSQNIYYKFGRNLHLRYLLIASGKTEAYMCTAVMWHNIVAHGYRPPDVFIQALLRPPTLLWRLTRLPGPFMRFFFDFDRWDYHTIGGG